MEINLILPEPQEMAKAGINELVESIKRKRATMGEMHYITSSELKTLFAYRDVFKRLFPDQTFDQISANLANFDAVITWKEKPKPEVKLTKEQVLEAALAEAAEYVTGVTGCEQPAQLIKLWQDCGAEKLRGARG